MRRKNAGKVPGPVSCKEEVNLIAGYLSSSLSSQITAAFEAHMGGCPDCVAFLQTYKKTIEATRAFLKSHPVSDRQQRRLSLRPLDSSNDR